MEHTGFPSEETLAAFIDGRLDEETRKKVVEHLADCAECRDAYLGGREWRVNEIQESRGLRRWSKRWMAIPLTVAAAIGAVMYFSSFMARHRDATAPPVAALFATANNLPYRSTDARLSGTTDYRPVEGSQRGNKGDAFHDPTKTNLVAEWANLKQRVQERHTVDNLHAFGVAALLIYDDDAAVSALQDAIEAETRQVDIHDAIATSTDVALLTDFTAALCERAEAGNHMDALLAAEAADRAWRIAKNPTTAWNRALAAEALGGSTAPDAWHDYLRLDSGSRWSVEAHQRLESKRPISALDWEHMRTELDRAAASGDSATVGRVVRRFPQEARTYAEDEILASWADSFERRRPVASDLARLRMVGDAIAQINGDLFVQDIARCIDELAESAGEEHNLSSLASAVRIYGQARDLHKRQVAGRAITLFQECIAVFHALNCPLWIRASIFSATSESYLGHYDKALAMFTAVIDEPLVTNRYPAALAQARWAKGTIEFSRGKALESLLDYESAVEIFERLGERENAAFLHLLRGQNLEFVGRLSEAWREYFKAIHSLSESGSRRRGPQILGYIAREALDGGYIAAAQVFRSAALKEGAGDDPAFRIDALMTSARLLTRSGDHDAASLEFVRAVDAARSIGDSRVQRARALDLYAAAIEARLRGSSSATAALTEAVELAKASGDNFRLGRFYFLRAMMQLSSRDALNDYDAAFATLNSNTSSLHGADRRRWMVDTRSHIDAAIRYAISQGDVQKALFWTEEARMHHGLQGSSSESSVSAVRSGDVVLDYWATDDGVYAWCVSHGHIDFVQLDVSRSVLRALVRSLRGELAETRTLEARRHLTHAYEVLIRPFDEQVSIAGRLVIVPDESMAGLPFSALFDRLDGRYLIERSPVIAAMTIAAAMNSTPVELSDHEEAAAIGDPAFNTDLFPMLKRLHRAADDGDIVQRHFRETIRFDGSEATIKAFETALSKVHLLHYAGHSISCADDDTQSALILAPDQRALGDSGLLYAAEIARMTKHSLKLVVLASCSSASGDEDGRDFSPLARAFIKIGIPNVIGTLWDVRDGEHVELMSAFYNALKSADVASALRRAQIEMIHSSKTLSWAAYELVAGSASATSTTDS